MYKKTAAAAGKKTDKPTKNDKNDKMSGGKKMCKDCKKPMGKCKC